MRTINEAYNLVKEAVFKTNFRITSCIDIGDSWVFNLEDNIGSFIPPAQVFKDENIEPDFYRGNLFFDCESKKITYTTIPLEEIV